MNKLFCPETGKPCHLSSELNDEIMKMRGKVNYTAGAITVLIALVMALIGVIVK